MGNLYVVAPLRDFWLKVFVGEGQLAGVSALPKPEGPSAEPTLNQGHYLFAYGLPAELIGRELRIAADVSRVNNLPQQGRASITAELWQTIPARFLPPAAQADAKLPRRLKSFSAEGVFGADSVARITLTIEIR
jgi:hypothetical protein